MTNEQLYLLLASLQNEVRATLELCEGLMPEGIERPSYKDVLGNVTVEQFDALQPFTDLLDNWKDRFGVLTERERNNG